MEAEINQFFDQFNSAASYVLLLFLLLAFLFGLLVGLLLQGGRLRRVREELKTAQDQLALHHQEVAELRVQTGDVRNSLAARDAEVERLRQELEGEHTRAQRLDKEKESLYKDLYALNDEFVRLQQTNESNQSTIEDLNDQILALKDYQELQARDRQSQPRQETQPSGGFEDRLAAIEQKMLQIESENISLKQELDDLKNRPRISETEPPATAGEPEPDRPVLDGGGAGAVNLLPETPAGAQESIAAGEEPEPDNLSLIHGIGSSIERRLNEIGVFYFQQIAGWDQTRMDEVTRQLGYFEGRIDKDDWVGQARRLARLKQQDPQALHRLAQHHFDPYDLQVVVGIDGEVEGVLKEAGVDNWEALAGLSAERLADILREAGVDSGRSSVATWPIQARLAVNGDWDLLEDYQRQMARSISD